ncbi:MAG: hypothetical protein NZM43_07055 [Saprospiraceae bacterium]|nr:hypothetical protein [Saprospiraceae bacterium]MDW8484067.1 LamG-like jellyroll fold domain-containing protein [Saprospiraceae bacterium]
MRTNIIVGICWVLLVLSLSIPQSYGQNVALHFDGDNDYIELFPINNLNPKGDFTVEMWWISQATGPLGNNCSGLFRRLFSLSGQGSRFEVGECEGTLSVFLSGVGIVQSTINVRDNKWHCISAVRSGGLITVYYDGSPVPGLIGLSGGLLIADIFRLGHWPGGYSPGQDWLGQIDEVKIWNSAQTNVACDSCVSRCDLPNLIAYWRFDEGIPNGNNTGLNQVSDCTSNGNNGVFHKNPNVTPSTFALIGSTSNFVSSNAPLLYPHYAHFNVLISDPLQTAALTSICSGEPVHFSIYDNLGNLAQAASGTTVTWEYSDNCTTFSPIAPGPGALFNGFSFVSPPNHSATTLTPTQCSPNAYINRCYRAIITITNGQTTCTYVTDPISLTICCPIQNAQLNVFPSGPLCEGNSPLFNVSLSNVPSPAPSNYVQISWCVSLGGGPWIPLPAFNNQTQISYPASPLTSPNICFKATISNCACPAVTVQQCVVVDPKPVCGTITAAPNPPTLMPHPNNNPNHYLICPGNHAALTFATPFTNCIPTWQFNFPNTQPGVWHDMGSSNSTQNTGTLPWSGPPVSPFAWPPNETCISYRIKCNPPTNPSGCSPCYSNDVRICLKPQPAPPVVVANSNPICKGGQAVLSVQNPDPSCTYQWYSNGLAVGVGTSYVANQEACYWVTCFDGCYTTASNKVCLTVCEPVAVICCPTPTCPCQGNPITLSGKEGLCSFGNCGPLTYFWSWTDVNGTHTATTPSITSIPLLSGTTYTLTVTDANGCTDTVQTTLVPCAR